VLALRDQVAPLTANLFHRDPRCDLDLPNEARKMKSAPRCRIARLGGTNATLAFRLL
jgi:3-oxoacyl-(acyl-carrier-protein) synthase